jgi:hypothetical protein
MCRVVVDVLELSEGGRSEAASAWARLDVARKCRDKVLSNSFSSTNPPRRSLAARSLFQPSNLRL